MADWVIATSSITHPLWVGIKSIITDHQIDINQESELDVILTKTRAATPKNSDISATENDDSIGCKASDLVAAQPEQPDDKTLLDDIESRIMEGLDIREPAKDYPWHWIDGTRKAAELVLALLRKQESASLEQPDDCRKIYKQMIGLLFDDLAQRYPAHEKPELYYALKTLEHALLSPKQQSPDWQALREEVARAIRNSSHSAFLNTWTEQLKAADAAIAVVRKAMGV